MYICFFFLLFCAILIYEPVREKTNKLGFRPGPTQTGLFCHRKWLEAGNFGLKKVEELFYPFSENKGADQLHSYCEADLRLCFCLCRLLVFPCVGSYKMASVIVT